jgi:hypothetical protein
LKDIEAYLRKGHSKEIVNTVVYLVDGKPDAFEDLFRCFTEMDYRMTQRASWAVSTVLEKWPELARPYHARMVKLLDESDKHASVRRNIMRVYQWADIPEEIEGKLFDIAIRFLQDSEQPIAVKVFSMTAAHRVVERYPDLANELYEAIRQCMPHGSAGLKNRGNKTLKMLEKFL